LAGVDEGAGGEMPGDGFMLLGNGGRSLLTFLVIYHLSSTAGWDGEFFTIIKHYIINNMGRFGGIRYRGEGYAWVFKSF
jgi:hypothetical protein